MSEEHTARTEHVITVESTRVYRGSVTPAMAEFLTMDGTRRNIHGTEFTGQGPGLDLYKEIKCTYECSCGQRFRKGKTAREHLEEVSSDAE